MNYTRLVINSTLKNVLRLRVVALVCIGIVFICVIGLAALFSTQFISPQLKSNNPDIHVIENFLGLVLFITSFISIGIFASVLAFQSLLREKVRGCIQALLATPVEPVNIWLGKSLGVFLPGLVFAELMTLASLLAINFFFLVPVIGFTITPWMALSSFVGVPLLFLAMTVLVNLVGLTGKPATANVIAQVFLPVMIALMINLAIRQVSSAGDWLFMVILLGAAAVIGFVVLGLRSRLRVEKIVLSG